MRLYRAALLSFLLAACGDDPGEVAGVFPDQGFRGRSLTVEVTGDTTSWDAGSTVNFGDGVTVDAVEVISPQALQVDITIDPATAVGPRDVTVTSGGDTLTLGEAFELVSPVAVETSTFEQGGLGVITITNLDLLNPFDDSIDQNFEFIGVKLTAAPAGVDLALVDVTPETITLSALIDIDGTTTGALTITSTTEGVATVTVADAVEVTPRAPQSIAIGGAASTFTMAANGSLLEVTADQAGLLNIDLTTADTVLAGAPGFIVLPASGKWADLQVIHENFGDTNDDAAVFNQIVAAGDKFYLIAMESPVEILFGSFFGPAGEPGYEATINASSVSLAGVTAVTEAEVNDTPDAAQALTGTVARFDGVLANGDDVDCFKIATTAANQKIHVYTTDTDGATDSVIEVFAADTADAASLVKSTDADLGEELVTDALTDPLTRSICVSASTFVADDFADGAYSAVVVIEP